MRDPWITSTARAEAITPMPRPAAKAMDGVASIAFAASLGIGVMASALAVLVIQGSLTVLGAALGSFLPEPHLLSLTATGGLVLAGVGLRLLQVRAVPVGDLLPALLVAPLLTQVVVVLQ